MWHNFLSFCHYSLICLHFPQAVSHSFSNDLAVSNNEVCVWISRALFPFQGWSISFPLMPRAHKEAVRVTRTSCGTWAIPSLFPPLPPKENSASTPHLFPPLPSLNLIQADMGKTGRDENRRFLSERACVYWQLQKDRGGKIKKQTPLG